MKSVIKSLRFKLVQFIFGKESIVNATIAMSNGATLELVNVVLVNVKIEGKAQ